MGRPIGSKDKVRRKFAHSFARQYLEDHNTQMFIGDKQILEPIGLKLYNIKHPNTRYYVGEQFIEQGEIRKIIKYEELKDLKYVIISLKITQKEKWDMGQKVKYVLRPIEESSSHIGKFPSEHYVEYDTQNKALRLIGNRAGPNGFSPWVSPKDKANKYTRKNAGMKKTYKGISKNAKEIIKKRMLHLAGYEDEAKPIQISEAAFMVTDSNEIVCFPNLPDMPSILIAGQKGTGKCIVQEEGYEYILDSKGNQVKIKNKPKDVLCLNDEGKIINTKVKEYSNRKVNEIIKLKTIHKEIRLTPEHRVFTNNGWISAENLKKGDLIGIIKPKHGIEENFTQYEMKLLGILIATSELHWKNAIMFGRKIEDQNTTQMIQNILTRMDPNLFIKNKKLINTEYTNKVERLIKRCGLWKKRRNEKFICNEILRCNEKLTLAFLNGYYEVVGEYRQPDNFILRCANKTVAYQLLTILQRFNINSTIKKKRHGVKSQGYTYYLKIGKYENSYNFAKLLSIKNEYKQNRINVFIKKSEVKKRLNFKKNIYKDIIWDKFKSKERIKGEFKVWDIGVENENHNFIANDIIVHNSYCLHSIVSRLFWKPAFNYKIVILNDSSRETGTWCFPNNDPKQILTLEKLNEKPLPLPCVYLHPLVKEDYEKLYMSEVGYDVTIPFKEIIEKDKEYLNLKDSRRYFTKIKEELLECQSEDAALMLLDSLPSSYNIPPQTATKIEAELQTLFDSKMTDISTKGQLPWRTSKNDKRYNPLTACIHGGVLPVLETEFISNDRSMLSIYFNYFGKDLFMRQKQDPDFLAEQSEILLVIDEVHNIANRSIGNTPASLLLTRCVREGRPRRIGTLLATQKFSELPDMIKDNTTFLICFKNPGEATKIANQYNMGKEAAGRIRDLSKHQCLAYTTDHYIVYDTNGKKRKSEPNEIFVGKTLPPYSMHKRPKARGN